MKNFNISYFVFVIILSVFLIPTTTFSQTNTNNKTFQKYCSINLNGGPTLFWGDLRHYDYYPVSEQQKRMENWLWLNPKLAN